MQATHIVLNVLRGLFKNEKKKFKRRRGDEMKRKRKRNQSFLYYFKIYYIFHTVHLSLDTTFSLEMLDLVFSFHKVNYKRKQIHVDTKVSQTLLNDFQC